MAKNVGKVLFGAALAGAAIVGGIAYLKKCRHTDETWEDDFEDFEDNFEEDLDEDTTDAHVTREYVTIPKEPKDDTSKAEVTPEDIDD